MVFFSTSRVISSLLAQRGRHVRARSRCQNGCNGPQVLGTAMSEEKTLLVACISAVHPSRAQKQESSGSADLSPSDTADVLAGRATNPAVAEEVGPCLPAAAVAVMTGEEHPAASSTARTVIFVVGEGGILVDAVAATRCRCERERDSGWDGLDPMARWNGTSMQGCRHDQNIQTALPHIFHYCS